MTEGLTLAQVISHVESRGRLDAVRYEPAWNTTANLARACMAANHCSYHTAIQLCKFSWGQYQIMGSNLYDLGFTCSIGDYLSNGETQLESFNEFLKEHSIDYTLEEILTDPALMHTFALRYNGNPLLYSAAIRSAYVELSK